MITTSLVAQTKAMILIRKLNRVCMVSVQQRQNLKGQRNTIDNPRVIKDILNHCLKGRVLQITRHSYTDFSISSSCKILSSDTT
jgi:hypothetical protein